MSRIESGWVGFNLGSGGGFGPPFVDVDQMVAARVQHGGASA